MPTQCAAGLIKVSAAARGRQEPLARIELGFSQHEFLRFKQQIFGDQGNQVCPTPQQRELRPRLGSDLHRTEGWLLAPRKERSRPLHPLTSATKLLLLIKFVAL